ncbi:60S ribosomal protein L31-like [Budorcas taxicolor]|uniref:60S ribosomal protein L31-like n=1 Tax=Budorcas taxicolor TaxID=37181 RepID=UPI0022853A88|nr:60S ribosomal protein L31-like [Budorcas taxicolor]
MAPTKKGSKKKGPSAIDKVVNREYTINVHKHIYRVSSRSMPLRHSNKSRNLSSRKPKEDEDSPNTLYTLVTYVPVATFKNLQTINVDENY